LGSSGRLTGIEKASRKGKSSNGNVASEIIMGNYTLPRKRQKDKKTEFPKRDARVSFFTAKVVACVLEMRYKNGF
jgi:hypothetical protein